MRLHAAVHLGVVEVLSFMNKGLPYLVQRCVVQVLGLKCRFVDHAVAWVFVVNQMLLDQLHGVHLGRRKRIIVRPFPLFTYLFFYGSCQTVICRVLVPGSCTDLAFLLSSPPHCGTAAQCGADTLVASIS